MILNHYIIPSIIYFLSCWHPTSSQIKEFVALCRNFLWGGDPWTKKIAKVRWQLCTVPVQSGGLGIKNIEELADRMAAKWVLRGL